MFKEGIRDWVAQSTNRLDALVIILNSMTLFLHTTDAVSLTLLRQLAALSLLGIWLQMFLWFRLFDRLAFYVDLINETIYDILFFILVFLELMVMFMMVFYML